MDSIKINMNAPKRVMMELNTEEFVINDEELLLTLNGKDCYNVDAGQTLIFKRFIYREDGIVYPITAKSEILYEDSNHVIHASIPYIDRCQILEYEKKDDYYVITTDIHDIFAQDLNEDSELYLMDSDDNVAETLTYGQFFVPNKYSLNPVTKDECIVSKSSADVCNPTAECRKINTYYYSFLPQSFSMTKLIVYCDEDTIKSSKFIRTKFNPFYYYNEDSEGVKHCVLYTDPWWDEFKESETECKKYINSGNTKSIMGVDDAYWKLGVGLSMDGNEDALGSEDTFSTNMVSDVEDSIIPDIIDMERIKYSPVIYENDAVSVITSITFDFHFRERVVNQSANTEQTKYNYYADGWYIDTETPNTKWWNGCTTKTTATTVADIDMENFIDNSGSTSDLLGYLNFTDADVYYQKKKVSKTFIRLSYYSKKDEDENINPLNENLLGYSTVFFDGGELYGKYVKQLVLAENYEGGEPPTAEDSDNANILFCTLESRVDSEIVVTNEYDTTSSSEGFNIYLFKEDAPLESEKLPKTIYLKIEFNHAGNGKTIQMILEGMWPKENGSYSSLTIDNYFESLYIPIELRNVDGKYYYTIPAARDEKDGNIRLILLEPKLDYKEQSNGVS